VYHLVPNEIFPCNGVSHFGFTYVRKIQHKVDSLFSPCLSSQQDPKTVSPNGLGKAPCEAANKEAFFNRVESYSISF